MSNAQADIADGGSQDAAERLLALLRALAVELHPDRAASLQVSLDSVLERDLGFDSLARAELLLRLEREFDVALPEQLLGEAELARDLLEALHSAAPGRFTAVPAATGLQVGPATAWPEHVDTLTAMLDWHAERAPERPHVILTRGRSDERVVSYGELAGDARRVATGLREWGLSPGGRVAIMLPTGADFLVSFFGILYAGGVPVPIYPPFRPSQLEEHLRRQAGTLANAGAEILLTVPEARAVGTLLRSLVPSLRAVQTPAQACAAEAEPAALVRPQAGDLAFLQYTSGSTGAPKGVMLSHANLLANIRAMGRAIQVQGDDVVVSWLPLYHDMGLIGAWLGSLYFAAPAAIMSPLSFLARPANWLWAIHRHRATISAAPNFAFELCRTRIHDDEITGLDLSSLRMIANGAEPVSAASIRGFIERFAPYGFRPEAMAPVYGLAECAVGLAFPPSGRGPRIDRISRSALAGRGAAVPVGAEHDPDDVQEIVACGQEIPEHEMRVVDHAGRELADRQEGRLQFRGPSATSGYYNNPAQTAELITDGWLESGDRAYLDKGDLFLTGRIKDIVIRAGRNIYPQEVEQLVGELPGVRTGCVAVFGAPDAASGTDRIVVLAETRLTGGDERDALREAVSAAAADVLGDPPDQVTLAPPGTVLKTSSGKIRRAATRELFLSGRVGRRSRALWWQIVRLGLHGLGPGLRQLLQRAGALAYAGWFWAVLGLVAGPAWAGVMLLPGRGARWRLLQVACRLVLWLAAVPRSVGGRDAVPADGAILVSNHASYADTIVLIASLPVPIPFVAKGELRDHAVAAPALRRLGVHMIERFDVAQSVSDMDVLRAALASGERLLFFAEGTLTRMPGLIGFQMGAFQLAVEADAPVVPIALRGTRNLLRGDQWFPRRAAVAVDIAPAQRGDGTDWAAALRLRDRVRAEILARCGEPDLAHVSAGDIFSQRRPAASDQN